MPVAKRWADLDIDFTAHPNTGNLSMKRDADAIVRSVRQLLLTNHYERPFHPEIGSNIQNLLFQHFGPISGNQLSRAIEEMIENFEPRARVETVECIPKPDTYTYDIIIYFYVENLPAELQEFQTVLETMR